MGFIEDRLAGLAATVALEGERTREAFAAGQQQTKDALRITGHRPTPFRPVVTNTGGRLTGWSLLAGAGGATVVFRDGADSGGDPIAVAVVPANDSRTQPVPGAGVAFVHGLFADVTAGSLAAGSAVWLGAVD